MNEENKRAGEISPVLNREDVAAVKKKLQGDRADYLERAEAEGTSKNEDFEAGYMACIRRMNGILNIRMKQIPPTHAPEVKEEKGFYCKAGDAESFGCRTQCEYCKIPFNAERVKDTPVEQK